MKSSASMETRDLSGNLWNDVLRYRRERLGTGILLPIALFLTTASRYQSQPVTPVEQLLRLLTACLLIAQFRLLDDLSDIARDRIAFPGRTLCRMESHDHFRKLVHLLSGVSLLLTGLLHGPGQAVFLLLLTAGMQIWYRWRGGHGSSGLAGCHVVLAKYPAFAWLLMSPSGQQSPQAALHAMAVVYLCFCAFDILDDSRIHRERFSSVVLAVELTLLGLLSSGTIGRSEFRGAENLIAPEFLRMAGCVLLIFVFLGHMIRTSRGGRASGLHVCAQTRFVEAGNYAVFLQGFLLLLSRPEP